MKFTDSGVSYELNPTDLELTEEISGKYCEETGNQKYPRHISGSQPKIDLKYRGTANCTGEPIDVKASSLQRYKATDSTVIPATTEAESPRSRQQLLAELNHIHLNNIYRNLEHRLQVARAKGDQNLIRLLEAEYKQLT